MIRLAKIYLARRKLEKLLRKRRESFEHQQYLKHRAAALKGRALM